MKFVHSLNLLGIAAGLTLSQTLGVRLADARPVQLDTLQCQITGKYGNGYWFNGTAKEIVLKREIYNSRFSIYPSRDVACKLPQAQSASLQLELAIPSNESSPAQIDFYLNGTPVASLKVEPGKVTSAQIPLTGRSGIPYAVQGRRTLAIETSCLGSECGYIYVLKGNLEIRQPPGR
jgi:hypothetical protein